MSLSPIPHSTAAALLARTQGVARGAGASNDFHTLDGERNDTPRLRGEPRRAAAIAKVSRSGPGFGAPLWYGPALRPAFVAQVIGQVLMEQGRSAPLAYREAIAQIPPGSFIDEAV
jgi:hypothetical protein